MGLLINEEEDLTGDDVEEEGDTDRESVGINSNAVREKFLKKSAELAENAKEKADKEKEEKEEKEATPF